MPERDNAALDVVIPFLEYFGESVERIAFQDCARQAQLVHADLHQGMLARVLHGESEHEGDGRASEHNPAALGFARHAVVVEMVVCRVHHQICENRVVELTDGLSPRVTEQVTNKEILKVVVMARQVMLIQYLRSHWNLPVPKI